MLPQDLPSISEKGEKNVSHSHFNTSNLFIYFHSIIFATSKIHHNQKFQYSDFLFKLYYFV